MKTPSAKKSLGQHFLTDPGLLRRIVEGAGVTAGDRVLEIGPGPGGLTAALLAAGARVWAVEADARMVQYLGEHLASERLQVEHGDALQLDYPQLAARAGGRLRLVANLPYNISGPLLALLLQRRAAFVGLTIMVQKEVGERLLAPPATRTRGRLSVMAQSFCAVRRLFRVPPGAFRPPPKVDSMVLRLDINDQPAAELRDEKCLWMVVGHAFQQRRKMLRRTLRGVVGEVDAVLADAGLAGTERPEELTVAQWAALANAISSRR